MIFYWSESMTFASPTSAGNKCWWSRWIVFFYCGKCLLTFFSFLFNYSESILSEAKNHADLASQSAQAQKSQKSKDDIVHLNHLFKEPSDKRHWMNQHGVLNWAQLDAQKLPPVYSEASNPLSCLLKRSNDYEKFRPQYVMVEYMSPGVNLPPIKKQPNQPSTTEWVYLANFTHDLDPCNISSKIMLKGDDWVKSTWTDCHKYLHLGTLLLDPAGSIVHVKCTKQLQGHPSWEAQDSRIEWESQAHL